MALRGNEIGLMNRMKTTPIPAQRTNRQHELRCLTSLPAGKVVPLAVIPLLREDSVSSGRMRIAFEMMETVEILMNAINVRCMAYLVPKLALERFKGGMDDLNRSYEGIAPEGGTVIPWFDAAPGGAHGANPILTYLGKHWREGDLVNSEYTEVYNAIWNFRAKNRSPDIPLRGRLDSTLAPAFWPHQTFAHIVPDFDQAVIDGEVALNSAGANVVLTPNYAPVNRLPNAAGVKAYVAGSQTVPAAGATNLDATQSFRSFSNQWVSIDPNGSLRADLSAITAELADNGITVSLSNLEMARKTQAFAAMRRQYSGHSDEYIIDLLMDGISIPDEAWKRPILLADESTSFGMSKRYASDGANLTESVVNGMTFIELGFNVPRCPTGGVIMITAEIAPEQLFERQKDPYFHASTVAQLPQFLRDTLDPEKVVVVTNDFVDVDHDTPDATFGYAPLGHEWAKSSPQIGGRFYRPTVDAAFDEDRQRIWAVETQNPVLSQDFYLCTTMHTKPFVVTNQDPFEALTRGVVNIRGLTVFGGLLVEANNDYAEIVEEQPVDRIQKPAGATEEKPATAE